jgi:predicted O-methyltransferase YrrM
MEEGRYVFTTDWFQHRVHLFSRFLRPLCEQPLTYLEIGIFEGQSFTWMLDNILTNSDSRAIGVDPFVDDALYERFTHNLHLSPGRGKAKVLKGFSREILAALKNEMFDVIYIDGSHVAKDVMVDLIEGFRLLKTNGIMFVDDYALGRGQFPLELRPEPAVKAFLTFYRSDVEVLYLDPESSDIEDHRKIVPVPVIIKKVLNRYSTTNHEFAVRGNVYNLISHVQSGRYYNWDTGKLYDGDDMMELVGAERERFEKEVLVRDSEGPLPASWEGR